MDDERPRTAEEQEAIRWLVKLKRTVDAISGVGGVLKGIGGWLLAMAAVYALMSGMFAQWILDRMTG